MNKIVFFDLGNTLIYRDRSVMDRDLELCSSVFKITRQKVEIALKHFSEIYPGVYNLSIDRAKSLEEEDKYIYKFFISVAKSLGAKTEKVALICSRRSVDPIYKIYEGTQSLLRDLKNKGYKLGIITNGRPSRLRVLKQMDIGWFFDKDKIYISDIIGLAKPNIELFRMISRNHKGLIYFCDDEEVNMKPARSVGWHTVLIDHKDNNCFSKIRKQL